MIFLQKITPFCLGVLIFLVVCGWRPLNVADLSWFPNHGDPLQAWLGWNFFRYSPWTFPLGLNPDYGLELNNAIIYTDSIPIFAFFFKLFSFILPEIFQYSGIWLLICFMLQSWLGWKLTRLYSESYLICFAGATLFTFSPAMLWSLQCHFTLVGHFLILAAIYLCLDHEKFYPHCGKWLFTLVVCALTHAYILVLCASLWVADMADRKKNREISSKHLCFECSIIFLAVAFCCWQAGYFANSPGEQGGFGFYKMNVLGMFDSNGWSYILDDLYTKKGEGFNYLGSGALLLLVWTVPLILAGKINIKKIMKKRWPFYTMLLFLAIFSFSNMINIGPYEFNFAKPKIIESILENFRTSMRMFWPIYYMFILFGIYAIIKNYKKNTAIILLFTAISLQIIDTGIIWRNFKQINNSYISNAQSRLTSEFWDKAGKNIKKIKIFPVVNAPAGWDSIGSYCAKNNIATDFVYLSRMDTKKMNEINRNTQKIIENKNFSKDTMYIINKEMYHRLKNMTLPNDVLLTKENGFYIIAPDQDIDAPS